MFDKNVILFLVLNLFFVVCLQAKDKRTDFIPSHKIMQQNGEKNSVVGKGNTNHKIESVKKSDDVEISEPENDSFSKRHLLNQKKHRVASVAKKNGNIEKDQIIKRDSIQPKQMSQDSISKQIYNQSMDFNNSKDVSKPQKSVNRNSGNGVFDRSVNVASLLIILVSVGVILLQFSGYYTKRNSNVVVASFSKEINDSEVNSATLLQNNKDIFSSITAREENTFSISDIEYQTTFDDGPINYETSHLARQFGKGHGEIELTMKMMTNRSSNVIQSKYSSQAALIGSVETENSLGKKKDAGIVAKELGVGKGEILLARHLEKIENTKTLKG